MSRRLPEKIYLERWPEDANREDTIHYEPVGYGIAPSGYSSRITVYVRERAKPKAKSKRRSRP